MQLKRAGVAPMTTDGDTQEVSWSGGIGALSIAGTFNGATVTLSYSPDNGTTWIATTTAPTAVGVYQFTLPPGKLKATISSAGASTSLNGWIACAQKK